MEDMPEQMTNENPRSFETELTVYLETVKRHKKLIAAIVGATFILSTIVSFLLPKVYTSTASVLPPQQEATLGASMIASQLPTAMGGALSGFLGLKSPADLWVGILNSNTVQDEIIKRFNLREVYDKEEIEDTRKSLEKNVSISKSKEEIILISVDDKDPETASRMANAFVEELDRINKQVVMSQGKRMRLFIEKRLLEAKDELDRIENEMKTFMETNRAVKLDEQSRVIIEAVGSIKGQLMARELELQTLLSYAAPTNPQVEILKTQVKQLKEQMRELDEGSGQKDLFVPTSNIPRLTARYTTLLRDAKIQETLFELLTQQFEMAKIQESKDSPIVQVLDYAKPPEKKSKPKRGLIIATATFASLLLSILLVFSIQWLERLRKMGA
ncbi:MAG TPA: hypothetical protein DCR11_03890 [Deltaproteobacteria bacterium]|nr:hypothetical protein [Deltaproteobacteria bacterium]